MPIKFSIVINTYNRADFLEDCLLGLSELSYPNFEVIVINGPSTDRTCGILERWQDKIKVGECLTANLSMSRNAGIEMADGDVIAFIDDDAVPHPAWLEKLAPHYYNPKVGGVGGFTIDNTGVKYQCRKTICDRFGHAYFPNDFFDERPLSFPSSPYYPSLLGTNSSFRASALREIGGFDHTFAYLLDETDVCLRLVDRGYGIIYEPDALVYHQFAPSHIRNKTRIAKTLYPSSVSKSYFIRRHGSEQRAEEEIQRYEGEILASNKWMADHDEITPEHRVSLDDDLLFGIRDGSQRAMLARVSEKGQQGDLDLTKLPGAFLPLTRKSGLRIALVSRSFPPDQEAGIARWTWMMASGLAARGHKVHVITLSSAEPFTKYEGGYWIHAIHEDPSDKAVHLAAVKRIPVGIARWCSAVEHQVKILKKFGLEVVSFPIWDVEGISLVDDPSLGVVMSLHTTYAMAREFKPEWTERPLFAHFHVDRVIAAEADLLKSVPHILANSEAIVDDLTHAYGVQFRDRTVIAPHGTLDPVDVDGDTCAAAIKERAAGSPLRVTYVGRFEPRKGFDIACGVFARLLDLDSRVEIFIAGDSLNEASSLVVREAGAENIVSDPRVHFLGSVSRTQLNELYLSSDIVLMPSRYESFGLVAIEAMAAGAVVIALAAGGLKEVVDDGDYGYLIEPGENAVSDIVGQILHLANSPELIESMKTAARQAFVDRYTIQKMIGAAEQVYFNAARKGMNHEA
jgi:glycosyltransferase involved in cell wall biosynthesis